MKIGKSKDTFRVGKMNERLECRKWPASYYDDYPHHLQAHFLQISCTAPFPLHLHPPNSIVAPPHTHTFNVTTWKLHQSSHHHLQMLTGHYWACIEVFFYWDSQEFAENAANRRSHTGENEKNGAINFKNTTFCDLHIYMYMYITWTCKMLLSIITLWAIEH